MNHTPEPWEISKVGICRTDEEGIYYAVCDVNSVATGGRIAECTAYRDGVDEMTIEHADTNTTGANAARIVACVNACAGIENPEDAINQARIALDAGIEALSAWEELAIANGEKDEGYESAVLRRLRNTLAALGGTK